jgi:tetratricopeptide (TPR) repeat protein
LVVATTVSDIEFCTWRTCRIDVLNIVSDIVSHCLLTVTESAAARYAKALSHCNKFVDLSPDDIQEVHSIKLTLNLNLSMMWIKLQDYDQALRYCNDALAMDESNMKGLYRRASVYYEQKNWEGASTDLKNALKGGQTDKAISKLQEKVDAEIKKQKSGEKKMAQKMFG